jgi:TRAP transporter TAXI family solute receptor
MQKRSFLTITAILLALTGIFFGAIYASNLPRTLTIAVGPAGLETHRYVTALAQAEIDGRERIRLKIITTSGAAESAKLLESGRSDLAVIRSDYDLPLNGQTLLVNTKRSIIIMAPQKRGGIQKLNDLKGKRVAVAILTDPNIPLVRKVLAVSELGEADVTLVESELADLPELLASGKADAAIAVVVPTASVFTDLVSTLAKRLPGGLRIIPIENAQAAADRIIGLEVVEIPAGAFGVGRPKDEISTVAISYRTMARKNMSDDLAGKVAKSFFDMRTRLSRQFPIAYNAEAPDMKTGARIPVHAGAMAYFDGESKTFLERYSELIFVGLWGVSIIGSALTGFIAWLGRKRFNEGKNLVEEITTLTASARKATTPDEITAIELRGDAIVAQLAKQRQEGHVSDALIESAGLTLDHYRSVIEQRQTDKGVVITHANGPLVPTRDR